MEMHIWKCPNCGVTIIAGFAQLPITEHYQAGFTKVLEEISGRGEVRNDYERPREVRIETPNSNTREQDS